MNKFLSRPVTSGKQRNLRWVLRLKLVILLSAIPAVSVAQTIDPARQDRNLDQSWTDAKLVRPRAVLPESPAPIVTSEKSEAHKILAFARVIFVRSTALLVKASTVEGKLRARAEFDQLRLSLTRDESSADLILELHPDLLTKYVYTAIDPKTGVVVASGKVSSLGGTVAGKVAKRFLKEVVKARG